VTIRDARPQEGEALAALQRRASLVWEEYRAQLEAHPELFVPETEAIAAGRARVAEADDGGVLGFSVVLEPRDGVVELDGLFVEPEAMGGGVGRALVADAVERARAAGARRMVVVAGPATGFYERQGFVRIGPAPTRFGTASLLARAL
jgi:N-acetylglutamate synthase-like GNAT family acetyltransferase